MASAQRLRVQFFRPGENEPAANLWVLPNAPAPTAMLLQHAYPDFAPVAGWEVAGGGKRYEVRGVEVQADGRRLLHVAEIGGA